MATRLKRSRSGRLLPTNAAASGDRLAASPACGRATGRCTQERGLWEANARSRRKTFERSPGLIPTPIPHDQGRAPVHGRSAPFGGRAVCQPRRVREARCGGGGRVSRRALPSAAGSRRGGGPGRAAVGRVGAIGAVVSKLALTRGRGAVRGLRASEYGPSGRIGGAKPTSHSLSGHGTSAPSESDHQGTIPPRACRADCAARSQSQEWGAYDSIASPTFANGSPFSSFQKLHTEACVV